MFILTLVWAALTPTHCTSPCYPHTALPPLQSTANSWRQQAKKSISDGTWYRWLQTWKHLYWYSYWIVGKWCQVSSLVSAQIPGFTADSEDLKIDFFLSKRLKNKTGFWQFKVRSVCLPSLRLRWVHQCHRTHLCSCSLYGQWVSAFLVLSFSSEFLWFLD